MSKREIKLIYPRIARPCTTPYVEKKRHGRHLTCAVWNVFEIPAILLHIKKQCLRQETMPQKSAPSLCFLCHVNGGDPKREVLIRDFCKPRIAKHRGKLFLLGKRLD